MNRTIERPPELPSALDGFVILGGGVCGALLAHELLISTDAPVWIIEAGGDSLETASDRQRPARWLNLLGGTDDDAHPTLESPGLANRKLVWPRGHGLGGSGRINAMIWMPPDRSDVDVLVAAGLDRSRLELAARTAMERFAPESPRYLSPPSRDFLSAIDGQSSLGRFFPFERINRFGRRWTTKDLLDRWISENTETSARIGHIRARVRRLHVRNDRATHLELTRDSATRTVELASNATTISCAGALSSPALLMRSGIGDPAELRSIGIEASLDLAGVGENLHDHLIMPIIHARRSPALPADFSIADLARWQHAGAGPISSNVAECGGFDLERRFQVHVTPTDYLRYPNSRPSDAPMMTLGVNLTRPSSRGRLSLGPVDPMDAKPTIRTGYLQSAADVSGMVDAIGWGRRLAGVMAARGLIGDEKIPGSRRRDDSQLLAAIARYSQTLYHPAGTCSIGPVVSADFRVRGVSNWHIVDASILPQPTLGNPTAVLAMLTCYAASVLSTMK